MAAPSDMLNNEDPNSKQWHPGNTWRLKYCDTADSQERARLLKDKHAKDKQAAG